jgi:hypothetical protein
MAGPRSPRSSPSVRGRRKPDEFRARPGMPARAFPGPVPFSPSSDLPTASLAISTSLVRPTRERILSRDRITPAGIVLSSRRVCRSTDPHCSVASGPLAIRTTPAEPHAPPVVPRQLLRQTPISGAGFGFPRWAGASRSIPSPHLARLCVPDFPIERSRTVRHFPNHPVPPHPDFHSFSEWYRSLAQHTMDCPIRAASSGNTMSRGIHGELLPLLVKCTHPGVLLKKRVSKLAWGRLPLATGRQTPLDAQGRAPGPTHEIRQHPERSSSRGRGERAS